MLEELEAVLTRIKETPGKNDKESILNEFKDNENIRRGLSFLLDTYIVTGLSSKKIKKQVKVSPNVELNSLEEAIDYLLDHNTGTDQDIANIQAFIGRNHGYVTFLQEYLTKTYKCGITVKTANKAIPDLNIPEFNCQLAYPYTKYTDRVKEDFSLTVKLDGHRTIVQVGELGDTKFFTRKGQPISGLNDIAEDIKDFANNSGILGNVKFNKGFILDGEAIVNDSNIPKKEQFKETSKIIRKDGIKKGLSLHVFDIVPTEEFFKGESKDKYVERRKDMETYFGKEEYKHLELLPLLYFGSDVAKITDIATEQIANDEEGLMINLNDTYKTKRHPGILKVKEFFTDDLLVTGVFEGTGKYEGTLGGVYVDYKGNEVKVGSGFNDAERDKFFNNTKLIVGKVIEVQNFGQTTNSKNDGLSLRFPIYKSLRSDKNYEDVSYES